MRTPINEEDEPVFRKILEKLVRLRKRENSKASLDFLNESIKNLHVYGEIKFGWRTTD